MNSNIHNGRGLRVPTGEGGGITVGAAAEGEQKRGASSFGNSKKMTVALDWTTKKNAREKRTAGRQHSSLLLVQCRRDFQQFV